MRIAICEDSQLDRELLVDVVGHYAAQRSRAIQVTAYDGGLGSGPRHGGRGILRPGLSGQSDGRHAGDPGGPPPAGS